MSTPTNANCPRCGTALASNAPEGLCPRCLGALNLLEDTALTGVLPAPAQPPLTPAELAPHFPQLEIIECLGRGGMGVVYKARQKTLNRLVALKLLAPERVTDAGFAERFTREAQALARLSHPNIVTIHDFGRTTPPQTPDPIPHPPFFYLLMEFVDGVNLRQAMKAGRFTPEQALAVVPPVCEALQYAHDHGIVHRDIKPENLLLDKAGRIKIADFGIAKMLGNSSASDSEVFSLASTGGEGRGEGAGASEAPPTGNLSAASVAGTPQYMAPEQKAHRATDHRADIYSLGVVLYELLTGELPAAQLQPPSRKVQIDVRLDEIVLRALEQKPELRFQTAGEFRTQVETVVATPANSRREEVFQPADPQRMPRGVASPKLAWVVVPVLLGAGLLLFFSGGSETTSNSAFDRYFPLFAFFGGLILIIGCSGWFALKQAKLGSSPRSLPVWLISGVPLLLTALVFHDSSRGNGIFWLGMALASLWSRERLGDTVGAKCLVGTGYAIIFGGLGLMLGKSHLPEAWQTWLRTPADTSLATVLATVAVLGTVAVTGWLTPLLFGLSPREAGKRARAPISFIQFPGLLLLLLPVLLFAGLLSRFLLNGNSPFGTAPAVTFTNVQHTVMGMSNTVLFTELDFRVEGNEPVELRVEFTGPGLPQAVAEALPRETADHGRLFASLRAREHNALLLQPEPTTAQQPRIHFKPGSHKWQIGFAFPNEKLTWQARGNFRAPITRLAPSRNGEQAWQFFAVGGDNNAHYQARLVARRSPFTDSGKSGQRSVKNDLVTHALLVKPHTNAVGFITATNAARLTWAPATLKGGAKPDLNAIRDQIKSLTKTGDYEEALQRQLWYFLHADEFDESAAMRLSFGITHWKELATRYSKAKLALVELRDERARHLAGGAGTNDAFKVFQEVSALDRQLGEEAATVSLFKSLQQQDAAVAQRCYLVVERQLVAAGDYALCRKFMGDPQQRFDMTLRSYQMSRAMYGGAGQTTLPLPSLPLSGTNHVAAGELPPLPPQALSPSPRPTRLPTPTSNLNMSESMKRTMETLFVDNVRLLVEVLVGTGDKTLAEKLRDQAASVLPHVRLDSAIADAEARIRER